MIKAIKDRLLEYLFFALTFSLIELLGNCIRTVIYNKPPIPLKELILFFIGAYITNTIFMEITRYLKWR